MTPANGLTSLPIVLLPLALLLGAGCKKTAGQRGTRFVDADELKRLERHFCDLGQRNGSKRCVRPVLRGRPVAGSGTSDLLAALTSPTHARCLASLKRQDHALWERYVPLWQLPDSEAARTTRTARSGRSPNATSPATRALAIECKTILSAVRKAVAHEDACGPFAVGVRGPPETLSWIDLARGLSLVPRGYLASGRAALAFASILDGLRFAQDLSRGPQHLVVLTTTTVMMMILSAELETFLNGRGTLPVGLLARVEREVGLLEKHEQHPQSYVRADLVSFALYEALPKVFGSSWTPPGGRGARSPTSPVSNADRDAMALGLVALEEVLEQLEATCPRRAPPDHCARGLRALAQKIAGTAKVDEKKLRALVEAAQAKGVKNEIRRATQVLLKTLMLSLYPKYLKLLGGRRFRLAALRLHARYRRIADGRGVCPDLAAFGKPPLKALTRDPSTGRPMRISGDGPGRFVVRMSAQAAYPKDGLGPPAVVIKCQH